MKCFLVMTIVLLVSCSHKKKVEEIEQIPVKISQTDIQSCREYQKNVLDRAYETVKKGQSTQVEFVKDEQQARELLAKFNLQRSLTQPKANLVQNILRSCDEKSLKKFDSDYKLLNGCSVMFSELNFFQGLASALKNYSWPTDLKLEGKKVALDYVTYYSEGNYPLLNRLVALSVLDELSVNEVVNKELHPEIKQIMQDSRTYVETLRARVNTNSSLSCESLDIIREELNYSNQVAEKMQSFLKRI